MLIARYKFKKNKKIKDKCKERLVSISKEIICYKRGKIVDKTKKCLIFALYEIEHAHPICIMYRLFLPPQWLRSVYAILYVLF